MKPSRSRAVIRLEKRRAIVLSRYPNFDFDSHHAEKMRRRQLEPRRPRKPKARPISSEEEEAMKEQEVLEYLDETYEDYGTDSKYGW